MYKKERITVGMLHEKKKDCKEAGEEFPMLKIIVEDDSRRIVSLSTRMLEPGLHHMSTHRELIS